MSRSWLLALALLGLACGDDATSSPDAHPPADAAPGPDAADDILAGLRAIPGMTVVEDAPTVAGYRTFRLVFEQPVDHQDPTGPTFPQRLRLLHRDAAAPMVLVTEGYYLWSEDLSEPAALLEANQVAVEHRFFPPSSPVPPPWPLLTIEQAAADHHAVVAALAPLYPGRWISTGASKSGMAAVYHRRFYPDDVDGTVAYVAPNSLAAPDPRYVTFLQTVGDPACRAALADFQLQVLSRRDAMKSRIDGLALTLDYTFDRLGTDMALEHATLEAPFAFWQYGDASGCALLPSATASDDDVFQFLDDTAGLYFFSDQGLADFLPYYVQASVQLGYPDYDEEAVRAYELYPGTYAPPTYVPDGFTPVYDPAAMADVAAWIDTAGRALLFVYGGNDPWSAGAFEVGGAQDSFRFFVPGGNHGSSIADLPEPDRTQAIDTVMRWGGLAGKRPGIVEGRRPIPRAPL